MDILSEEKIEQLFNVLNKSSEILSKSFDQSYLDSLTQTLENINSNSVDEKGLSEPDKNKLAKLYQRVVPESLESEDIRKSIQMAILKAIKADNIQANYQITPDTIAFVLRYLISGIKRGSKKISLIDPAMGTGNLLASIYNQLNSSLNVKPSMTGIENDDAMSELAAASFELERIVVDLLHEDAVSDVVAPNNVDIAVSDLPVGYYPIDDNVKNFETRSLSGHSYVHHVLIEYAMNHVVDGGFGMFLVPSQLFQTSEAKSFLKWIQDKVYLQGMLNLPLELFLNKSAQKSILILQKHGGNAHQANKVMIGEFPSFKDEAGFRKFLTEIDDWEINDLLK